ncbi:putative RNA-binding protein C4F6.14 [Pseudocercospora fuligena]|uniref:Putative RNA-binding protein C4F6.14 n=1 Tax=Pseudocercospora fuligena TaxID=685502 RepID=A0A8H6R703_9PEZI|nr:putative RNA-binding protein C4F6.14 [Pseudocercospora fuligena]
MAPARKKLRGSDGGAIVTQTHTEEVDNSSQAEKRTQTANEQEQKAADAAQGRSLFVRSLPVSTTSESLTELFSDEYPVKHATAVIDPATKECRGYGFVTFADAEDAAKAKKQFNGHVLDGKKLRVEVAEKRHRNGENGEGAPQKKEQEQQPPQQSKLIVRNLPWSIKGSEQLTRLFQSYGKVKKAYVPKKGPGLMAGFGFVVMRGRKNAEKAIEGVNGKEIDGRTLAVDWSVEKNVYENQPQDEQEDEENAQAGVEIEEDLMEDEEDHGSDSASDASGTESDDDEEGGVDDDDDESVEVDLGDDVEQQAQDRSEDRSKTLFVRNLPFTCTDEDLEDHFQQFGSNRYARVVMDYGTERSKGTGFVCFYNKEDADACLRNAPIRPAASLPEKSKDGKPAQAPHSILQNDMADPTGQYTLDGRVLQVTRAVDKSEANRLTEEGVNHRYKRDNDKRKLYLLSEGTISSKSKLWEQLPPSERAMREASVKQRKQLIESNPSLSLSLTRLSVRNIPRSVDSRQLKDLARAAVVGFATEVKEGQRSRLSKEELARGGEEMQAAEKARREAGKGIVKQAKVVFESAGGSKVSEESGAGRSRGYGFIEYHTHRNALMGLRWLNGHAIDYQVKDKEGKGKLSREEIQDRKKRLIVEFAIENAQVVKRRQEMELKSRSRSQAVKQGLTSEDGDVEGSEPSKGKRKGEKPSSRKRKRDSDAVRPSKAAASKSDKKTKTEAKKPVDEKLARRNQIIGRKRAMRARRKGGKA